MSEYTPTIGLEIHAELKTKTKMFCSSKNDTDEKKPNVNICPICMGHPGTLPVINKQAVRSILKIGIAVGGNVADFSEFDRKNYFYPDIPKSYQISQYKFPLVSGGSLSGVAITRVHLEEDTARSIHEKDGSLIDFNRAGVPLMELVTEPVIKSAEAAMDFAKELQLLLKTLGIAEANMEKGEMRVEANISVSKDNDFGTKVEVKNLNSFRVVGKAIEFEIKRQIAAIESGEGVVQETRGYDEKSGTTFSQRKKESSHDYRYFPDPDLPKLMLSEISEFEVTGLKKELPELPWVKRTRLQSEFGISKDDASMYIADRDLGNLFESTVSLLDTIEEKRMASNYITSDLAGLVAASGVRPAHIFQNLEYAKNTIARIIKMLSSDVISSRGAKDILAVIFEKAGDPEKIVKEKNLAQMSGEGELLEVVKKVIEQNNKVVTEYKEGKQGALQFLIGQGMKETKGSANPQLLKNLLLRILG